MEPRESTELQVSPVHSSSNIQADDEEIKRNLVPTPPLVPWLPALRGAMADIDGFQTDRKPSWCGGLSTCTFLLVFIIVLIVYIVNTNNTILVQQNQHDVSTAGVKIPVNIQCLSATPTGEYLGGTCDVTVQYKQGSTVSANNASDRNQMIYVPHNCSGDGKKAVIQVGQGVDATLCFSWGVVDGITIITTPNVSKASILEAQTYFDIPQDAGGFYDLEAILINNETDADNTVKSWEFSANSITQGSSNASDSTARLRLSDSSVTVDTTTIYSSPSIGEIGGSAFLLWLVLKFLSDVHYRVTKPYAGNLEVKAQPRRRPSQ